MFTFDARSVAPWQGFELCPDGWHDVVIRKSNMKPNAAGTGSFIEVQYEVQTGPAQGKLVFDRLNVQNTSHEAVDIAYKKLSALCHVTGVFSVTAQNIPDMVIAPLHNIPFKIEVGTQKGEKGNLNTVLRYKDVNGNDPGKSAGGAPQMGGPAPGYGQPPAGMPPGAYGGAPAPQPGYAPPQPAYAPPGQAPQPAPGQWPQAGAPPAPPAPPPGYAPPPPAGPQGWQPGPGQAPGMPAQQGYPAAPPPAAPPPAQPGWTPGAAPGAPPNGGPPWGGQR